MALPIPEWSRMLGVPIAPAERMTSLDAVRFLRVPIHINVVSIIKEKDFQSNVDMIGARKTAPEIESRYSITLKELLDDGRILDTLVFSKISRFSRASTWGVK